MMWVPLSAPDARALLASSTIHTPQLIVELGPGRFHVARFEYDARWRIGRLPGNELPIEFDETASDFHAFVVREADRFFVDNPHPGGGGTYVNARPVTRRRLDDRDVITCGQTAIIVRCPPGDG